MPGSGSDALASNDRITFELDPCAAAPLSDTERAEIEDLAAQPEATIDTSDLPPLGEAFLTNAVRDPVRG
ncbi:hypothetical protein [Methylobacterium oxalidis]|uniref:Uncharacterized protein n=1 Tax=Methylobacterium oxalidis TaxID=944322 RepID=A0A512J9V8_9HYPH|nr:hypothetical protein [Methylobacterium oxalidis]GEP06750.1 hypothetical protein MOX02_47880 [Methylobacterium oxalidis]GJE35602.1 hypothetical protein LDDCCGHA_5821 [Methylobacterium oxalidis]GLS67958.1 hypothetical protein GCM10007888_63430 [Methylobacterium oxalidis]